MKKCLFPKILFNKWQLIEGFAINNKYLFLGSDKLSLISFTTSTFLFLLMILYISDKYLGISSL